MYQRNNFTLDNNLKVQFNNFLNNNKLKDKSLKKKLVKNYLIKNNHFFIYDLKINSKREFESKLKKVCKLFGKPVKQNLKKETIVKIKPKKTNRLSLQNRLRYHQTNTGGSIHTDGPQLFTTPKYLIMGCFTQSRNGGDTVIVNGKKIFNEFNIITQKILKSNFYFERRGFGKKILKKPVFQITKKNFIFRYLREYLIKAYDLKKIRIDIEKSKALNDLDKSLNKTKNQIKFKLKKKQIIVINNHICAHGRKKFIIEKNTPRLLYRLWAR